MFVPPVYHLIPDDAVHAGAVLRNRALGTNVTVLDRTQDEVVLRFEDGSTARKQVLGVRAWYVPNEGAR